MGGLVLATSRAQARWMEWEERGGAWMGEAFAVTVVVVAERAAEIVAVAVIGCRVLLERALLCRG